MPRASRTLLAALAIAPVALPRLGFRLRGAAPVGGERATHVVALLDLARGVSPHVALVGAGVDELALGGALALASAAAAGAALGPRTRCLRRHAKASFNR